MNLLGISSTGKLILAIVVLSLDLLVLKTWRITLPTLLEYTPNQKKFLQRTSWLGGWILALVILKTVL